MIIAIIILSLTNLYLAASVLFSEYLALIQHGQKEHHNSWANGPSTVASKLTLYYLRTFGYMRKNGELTPRGLTKKAHYFPQDHP